MTRDHKILIIIALLALLVMNLDRPEDHSLPLSQVQRDSVMSRSMHSLEWAACVKNQR